MSLLVINNLKLKNIDITLSYLDNIKEILIYSKYINSLKIKALSILFDKYLLVITSKELWRKYYEENKKDIDIEFDINEFNYEITIDYYHLIGVKSNKYLKYKGEILTTIIKKEFKFNLILDNIYSLSYYKLIIIYNSNNLIKCDINDLLKGLYDVSTYIGNDTYITDIFTVFNSTIFEDYIDDTQWKLVDGIKYYNVKDIYVNYIVDNSDRYIELTKMLEKRVTSKRYLTLYCYYEKPGYTKNQTNLQHFINYGLEEENMDYVFIINGFKCSVELPTRENVKVEYRKNCMDFEAWGIWLNNNDWSQYEYIFFINCSVLGPLNFDNSNTIIKSWVKPFLEKMSSEVVLCSNVITKIGGEPKCTSYNFLLDTRMIPILLTKKIMGGVKYYNTVFGRKKDRHDAVLTGEYGLSKVVLLMDYQITCLHPGMSDRGQLQMTIFMKNNWIDVQMRACPPINYRRCMEIIGKEVKSPPEHYDYSNLNCSETGVCYTNRNFNWNSKKEFYEKFGYSEEIIF